MSELIAIVYPTEERAREVINRLREMEDARLVLIEDACYVTKDERGRLELHQTVDTSARSAIGGAFWGTVVGFVLWNPLLGMAAGAATGAIAGWLTDIGISDDFMRSFTRELEPGRAALFVLVQRAAVDQFIAELASYGGHILHSSLATDVELRLRAALEEQYTTVTQGRLSTVGAL